MSYKLFTNNEKNELVRPKTLYENEEGLYPPNSQMDYIRKYEIDEYIGEHTHDETARQMARDAYNLAYTANTTANNAYNMAEEADDLADIAYDLAYSKQDELVSGENIKTINNQTILGPGNIEIAAGRSYERLERLGDFIYEVWYGPTDYNDVEKYFDIHYKPTAALCTTVRANNFFGRNLDWYYSNLADFIVHTPAENGRHEVLALCNMEGLTEQFIQSGEYSEKYLYLPYHLTDGINDSGLCCSVNVVPTDSEYGRTYGTNPGKPNMNGLLIVRYILDNHTVALDAVNDIADNFNVYMPNTAERSDEFHYIVADKDYTYLLEFINNEAVITDISDKPYMTNFRLYNTREDLTGHIDYNSVEQYGNGLERYDIVGDALDTMTVNDVGDLENILDMVKYTLTYTQDPTWKTEFAGLYGRKVTDPYSDYEEIIAGARAAYNERTRDEELTWQTMHRSVYDMHERSLHILTQEGLTTTGILTRQIEVKQYLEAGEGIDITDNVISVKNYDDLATVDDIPTNTSDLVNDSDFTNTDDVHNIAVEVSHVEITTALEDYNPTDNFKTVNNQSLIGTGDIEISGDDTVYLDVVSETYTEDYDEAKCYMHDDTTHTTEINADTIKALYDDGKKFYVYLEINGEDNFNYKQNGYFNASYDDWGGGTYSIKLTSTFFNDTVGSIPRIYAVELDYDNGFDNYLVTNTVMKPYTAGTGIDDDLFMFGEIAVKNYDNLATVDEIPTKTSDLVNDSGFITSSDIPEIPTKTSDLTNDSDFTTNQYVNSTFNPTNNFKTVNNQSLIGTGDIEIQGGAANLVELTQAEYDALVTKDPDVLYLITDAPAYQQQLISGTNIKTINNNSLLGSGNLEIKSTKETIKFYNNRFYWIDDENFTTPISDITELDNFFKSNLIGGPGVVIEYWFRTTRSYGNPRYIDTRQGGFYCSTDTPIDSNSRYIACNVNNTNYGFFGYNYFYYLKSGSIIYVYNNETLWNNVIEGYADTSTTSDFSTSSNFFPNSPKVKAKLLDINNYAKLIWTGTEGEYEALPDKTEYEIYLIEE